MPRTGKGGKVAGAPGKAYSNRTDLNTTKALPIQADKGQGYGEAGAQRAAQRAIPLEGQNANVPAPQAAPQSTASQPAPAPGAMAPQMATMANPTMQPPDINAPGAGPEAVQAHLQAPQANAVGGAASNDPEHLRLLSLVQDMAHAPFATSGVRDLAEFMRTMVL